MQVREICNSPLATISVGETLATAAAAMRDANVSSLGVTEDGAVVGILTERDLVQAIADRCSLRRSAVAAYMTTEVFGAEGDIDAAEAASLMLDKGVRHLPVLDGGEIVGMISTRDLLLLEAWPAA